MTTTAITIKPYLGVYPYYILTLKFPEGTILTYELRFYQELATSVAAALQENEYTVILGRLGDDINSTFSYHLYFKSTGEVYTYMSPDGINFKLSESTTLILRNKLLTFFSDYVRYKQEPGKYKVEGEY